MVDFKITKTCVMDALKYYILITTVYTYFLLTNLYVKLVAYIILGVSINIYVTYLQVKCISPQAVACKPLAQSSYLVDELLLTECLLTSFRHIKSIVYDMCGTLGKSTFSCQLYFNSHSSKVRGTYPQQQFCYPDFNFSLTV